ARPLWSNSATSSIAPWPRRPRSWAWLRRRPRKIGPMPGPGSAATGSTPKKPRRPEKTPGFCSPFSHWMMRPHPHEENAMSDSGIFQVAVKLAPERRAAYLDQACGGDHALRREVESLLQAHEDPSSFLQSHPADPAATVSSVASAERPGTFIG